jgi:hypothetical protein
VINSIENGGESRECVVEDLVQNGIREEEEEVMVEEGKSAVSQQKERGRRRKEECCVGLGFIFTHCCVFTICTLLFARYTPVCSKLIGKITKFFLVVLLDIFVNS